MKLRNPSDCSLPLLHPARLVCTCFGIGRAPFAPGTFGSLAALPLGWWLHTQLGTVGVLIGAVCVFILGWWACAVYLMYSGKADPGEIVIDEVAGQLVLLAVLPPTPGFYALGFVLFRLFDIFKPWPVSVADRRMKTSLGVMLDDMMAGFYPLLILMLAFLAATWAGQAEWVERMALLLGTPWG